MLLRVALVTIDVLEESKGCEVLRIPHSLDIRFTDGSKIVNVTGSRRFATHKHYFSAFGTH
jgi:hypothetical protein